MNRSVALCGAAAIALAGCQSFSATSTKVDAAIQKNLPGACTLFASGYASIQAINQATPLPSNIMRSVIAAKAAAETICDDLGQVTTANALIVVTDAYVAVVEALKAAERIEDARAAERP